MSVGWWWCRWESAVPRRGKDGRRQLSGNRIRAWTAHETLARTQSVFYYCLQHLSAHSFARNVYSSTCKAGLSIKSARAGYVQYIGVWRIFQDRVGELLSWAPPQYSFYFYIFKNVLFEWKNMFCYKKGTSNWYFTSICLLIATCLLMFHIFFKYLNEQIFSLFCVVKVSSFTNSSANRDLHYNLRLPQIEDNILAKKVTCLVLLSLGY